MMGRNMPKIKLPRTNTLFLGIVAPVLLLLTALLVYIEMESSRPWKAYQRQFNELDEKITNQEREAAERMPEGEEKAAILARLDKAEESIECRSLAIRQFWFTDLGITDRCMTCHLGVESSRFIDADQPFTTHPGKHLAPDHHPVENFGCVTCHDGQGVALTVAEAHAETADIWLKPILRGELAEASCSRCHPFSDAVPQHLEFPEAPHLTNGKRLYLDEGCLGCHVLAGFQVPQHLAPNLTRVVEKVDNGYMKLWITKPKDILPETIMPFFDLKEEQIDQIGAYLASLPAGKEHPGKVQGDANAGKALLGEVGCLSCHTVGDSGGTFGPDLNRAAEKIKSQGWLLDWIDEPSAYDAETAMPDFRLEPKQLQDIAAYVLTLRKADLAPATFAPEGAEEGKALFSTLGCTGCHKVEGMVYGFPRSPEHTGYADKDMEMFDFGNVTDIPKTKAAWTKKKLEEPRAFSTETIKLVMPEVGLTAEEIRDLRVWMLSLTAHEVPAEYRKTVVDTDDPFIRGMLVVEQYNCTGCHKMGLTAKEMEVNDDFPEDWLWAAATYALEDIVIDGQVVYPQGSELTEPQAEALVARYPEIADSLFNKRWFLDYDNVGYLMDMGIEKVKVFGMDEGDIVPNYKDLNFAPPILHYEGIKAQPNWLSQFLGAPYPIRPLTKATMPTFNLSREDIDDLVAFFVAKDSMDKMYFPVEELTVEETDKAEEVFKICLQCHYFDQTRVYDKTKFENLKGPNLAEVKRRLRPQYIRQWVHYPDLVIPGTQMKNFFYEFTIDDRFEEIAKDETGITDLEPEEKIRMMANFLMNPFKSARLSVQR